MAFDPTPLGGGGGDPYEHLCESCQKPIREGQPKIRVDFDNDPQGHKGLSGLYHQECSKPFLSLSRVINLNWFGRL